MTQNPYPHLGWNPVPGIPDEVRSLKTKVHTAAKALRSSHQQIERLLGESSHWEGDAADAFRDALDGDLPKYMKAAATSMEKAATQLGNWDGTLGSHRELAKKYDQEAKEKKAAQHAANEHYEGAKKDPDLDLGGKQFPSQAEADAATDRLRSAEHKLKQAAANLEKANDAYDDVIKKAQNLEKEHSQDADKVADHLDEADDKLAPQEPGWLSKAVHAIWDGIKAVAGFIYQHIGTIGAIAGLLALIPTPLSPIFAGIAVAASAIALGKDVTENWDDLSHPGWNMDTFSAYASVVGDAVGLIPGVGALGRAGSETIFASKLATESGEALSAGAKASTFASETVTAFSRGAEGAAAGAKGLDYSLGGVNVGANVLSDVENAGVLPEEGAGHNANEVVKAGLTARDGYGAVGDVAHVVGEVGAAIRL